MTSAWANRQSLRTSPRPLPHIQLRDSVCSVLPEVFVSIRLAHPVRSSQAERGARTMRDAIITLVAVVLALAAIDDITTDHATTGFVPERTALVVCTGWFVFLAWRIWQSGRRPLALTSLAAALAIGLAQWAIGPATAPGRVAYLVTLAGLGCFLVVAGAL